MKNIVCFLLFLLGASLWLPGISLFNIGNSWGLQLSLFVAFLLFFLMLLSGIGVKQDLGKINIKSDIISSHIILFSGFFICTIFSSVGVERSALTFMAELNGIAFSYTISWWLCRNSQNIIVFFQGFKLGGLLSSIYAAYQFIGLKIGLPFAYIEMNNTSFSILDNSSAAYHGRALGITPEPSILASLIAMALGILIIDIIVKGSFNDYMFLSIFLIGIFCTVSQSIISLPFYFGLVMWLAKSINLSFRKISKIDHAGILCLSLFVMLTFAANPDIGNIVSRILEIDTSTAQNQSATSRFYDIIVAARMFANMPIFGNGLGSFTDLAASTRSALNFDGDSGASSSFFRILGEQGLVSIFVMYSVIRIINPTQIKNMLKKNSEFTEKNNLQFAAYSLALILSILMSMIFFIGYKNLYHIWLLLPMLLTFKSYSLRSITN